VETPHRALDMEDWSRVTQGLFGEEKGTMGPRVSLAVEKASRIAECPPGIFRLVSDIGRGDDIVCWPDGTLRPELTLNRCSGRTPSQSVYISNEKAREALHPVSPRRSGTRHVRLLLTHLVTVNVGLTAPRAGSNVSSLSSRTFDALRSQQCPLAAAQVGRGIRLAFHTSRVYSLDRALDQRLCSEERAFLAM
jgi:hypothetical protein